jgi:hypothetical protein
MANIDEWVKTGFSTFTPVMQGYPQVVHQKRGVFAGSVCITFAGR